MASFGIALALSEDGSEVVAWHIRTFNRPLKSQAEEGFPPFDKRKGELRSALAFVNADHHVTRINRTVNKRLYKKREVEQKAWEKHGGPDGFDAYVRRLQHNRFKRALAKPIPQPSTSNAATSTHVAQPLPVPSRDGRSWVLEACNRALDWDDRTYSNPYEGSFPLYDSPRARAKPMQEALRFQATYPLSRPTVPLPASPTIDALRAILAEAPRLPKEQAHSFEPILVLGIDATHHSWPEEDYSYEWATWYLNNLFTALCNVIIVHGTGEAGWLSIRWEVYDKYTECIGGISYDRKDGWADGAAHWLDGAYSLDDPRNIAFSFSSRSKSVVGSRYNQMLPYRTPADHPHVGRG
ncbi:uncharacterized protein TRAVEDRAFT_53896 [Trametes versicolor FP-101664 SS1]|uniref:uncharacterized protein n=1 Tax=Trametes versicolor (strain FP-101664) TaxID=717944 RepID=UPI00046242B4|nr:uncharacterized protein TRAVEDRAFT_53896 [Trametes versicolor FP-101664 SS1]EIW52475.1 hypothetical protein TRAVEDRAFT_53896 [Trametes versicolor FP-101664 SS1]